MGLKVTEQDRRRVKTTALVFTVIFIVCAMLAGIFVALIPRADDITMLTLGDKEEQITSMIDSHDGQTYFLQSDNLLGEFDTFTSEQLSMINLTDTITAKVTEEKAAFVKNSFMKWRVSAFTGKTNKYFIVTDNNGNLFKMEKNSKGEFVVHDDFYLVENNTEIREVLGMDHIGDDLYVLIKENNYFYVEQYDMADVSAPIKKKFLWDKALGIHSENGVEYVQIEALGATTGVLAFYAHGDSLYLVKAQSGDIMRMSIDLVDTKYGGQEIDFFGDAEKANEGSAERDELYEQVRAETYRETLIPELAKACVKYVVEYSKEFKINGVLVQASQIVDANGNAATKDALKNNRAEVNKKTEELFANLTEAELNQTVEDNKDYSDVKQAKTKATNVAKKAAEEATAVNLDWFRNYANMKMYVHPAYLDSNCYATFSRGDSTVFGVVLSKKNNAFYYTNASDGYLYVVNVDDLKLVENGGIYSEKATKIENIKCPDGVMFDSFGNALGYNKFANTLYIKYSYKRDVVIVDINNMSDYKVISAFTGAFDMYGLSGDKDNEVTRVMRKVGKTDIHNNTTSTYYITNYEPERFENKTIITIVFVVFMAIAMVTFIIGLWLWLNLRTEKGVKKIVFIAKDTKKNKFVYFALFFFIAMLIMFCYYEAFGAIAMSFFDYTKQKPAWIWNNFANYIKIFHNEFFLSSVGNMLFFLAADLILSIIPPVIFAILLILIRNKVTSNWIRSLMFIPGIIPSMAAMLIWREGIYGHDGILNQIIRACGGETVQWFLEESVARWSLLLMGFPYIGGYLIFYGGMMNIPTEYHEAGKLEGLGTIKRFLKIDIPLIMPQIKYIFITTFIASVQNFSRTYILSAPSVATPVHKMYVAMQEQSDYGMSSAWATLIFIFLFAAIATNFKMQKQDAMGADL